MRATIAVVLGMVAQAQQRPAAPAEFEAVSVKPADPASLGSSWGAPPGRLVMRGTTLKNLILSAYHLNEYQVCGGPMWVDSARFNIDAKLPAGAPQDRIPFMTQSMLADRFKLEFHRETRILREFALVIAKGGPRLGKPNEGDHNGVATSQNTNQITGWGRPISELVGMLIGAVGAPVIDQTGLRGRYDFDLKFASLDASGDDTLPSIFAVVQEQLGLKLEAIKGPVEVFIIDRAEKPSEN